LFQSFVYAMIGNPIIEKNNMTGMRDGIPRDARHLVLFDEIYRSQSMTRSAQTLGLSQPTASIWLSKLRRQLADPLFVRTSSGVRPTPRADALIGPVREVLELLRGLAGQGAAFDPRAVERNFRVAMTDASHITLLPKVLARVRAEAPRVGLEVAPISAATGRALESGEVDLALGLIPGLEAGFHEQSLYLQDFVCLAATDHPRIRDSLGLRAYRDEAHIGILSATSYTMLDDALKRQRIRRRVLLELPGFLGLGAIVSSTDLVATVPRLIGETLARGGEIKVFSCPVKIPAFEVRQYWHARYHYDAGNRWLRSIVVELFAKRRDLRREARA
jgi:DNA-binding transcriptional LysR family regulator